MTRGGIVVALVWLALLAPQAAAARERAVVDGPTAVDRQATTIGFWAGESVPGTDWSSPDTYWMRRDLHAYTPSLWRVLRRNRIPLYFNLRYRRDFGPIAPGKPHRHDALSVIRTANRLGVPVWGWVLIPYEDGYWAWEGAAAEQFAATRALAGWARKKHVRLRGLVLDPEPRVRTPPEALAAILGGSDDNALTALFQQTIDPSGQCAAWHGYTDVVRWACATRSRSRPRPCPPRSTTSTTAISRSRTQPGS